VVYAVDGEIPAAMRKDLINPVESREAALELPETLALHVDTPADVETLEGFTALSDAALPEFVVYAVDGEIPAAMRKDLINPVESREAALELPET
ncbi:hypothetical protein HT105_24265, partial [Bacteroides fragilis]|nr:hypothetical protein [Bacteroides fragilis]